MLISLIMVIILLMILLITTILEDICADDCRRAFFFLLSCTWRHSLGVFGRGVLSESSGPVIGKFNENLALIGPGWSWIHSKLNATLTPRVDFLRGTSLNSFQLCSIYLQPTFNHDEGGFLQFRQFLEFLQFLQFLQFLLFLFSIVFEFKLSVGIHVKDYLNRILYSFPSSDP